MAMEQESFDDISSFYNSAALHRLQSLCSRDNFMEICGKKGSETAHSAFLKWLFENDEFSRLPLSPVITFLRLCTLRSALQKIHIAREDLFRKIMTGGIKSIKSIIAKNEVVTPDNRKIDIELNIILDDGTKVRACIENKLFTKEHNNQCESYYKYYNALKDGIPTMFVFLSPDVRNTTQNNHYVHLLYQDIYDCVLFPLYEYYREHHSTRSIAYLKDYMETLTSFNEDFKPIVMSDEYRSLLKEIYENHKDIFFEAISLCGTDEEKKMVKNTTYTVSYNNGTEKLAVGYTKMARTVIETLLQNGIPESVLLAKLAKVDITGFDAVVVSDINTKGADSRYQKKPVDGSTLYVSNQWNADKAKKFINVVSKEYPQIKIQG